MAEVQFVRFVQPVKGRLVSRWDAPESYIGARFTSEAERAAGAEAVEWNEALVLPLTREFCDRYLRELRKALKNGDLKEVDEAAYRAWLAVEGEREAAKVKALEEAAAKSSEAPTEPPPPPVANEPTEASKKGKSK